MGLDMYLMKRNKKHKECEVEVCYWRKANQIRKWFVNHIDQFNQEDNCKEFILSKEILEKLVYDCKYVLKNHDKAEEVLPTSSGFFFGETKYDKWYFITLEDTVKNIQKVIETTDFESEEIYYYDWW